MKLMLNEKGSIAFITIIILVLFGIVGVSAYFYLNSRTPSQSQTYNTLKNAPLSDPSFIPQPTASASAESSLNWKTYSGTSLDSNSKKITINLSYPSDWNLEGQDPYKQIVSPDPENLKRVFVICCWERETPWVNMQTGEDIPSVKKKTFPAGEAKYLWNDGPEYGSASGYVRFSNGIFFNFSAPKDKDSKENEKIFNQILSTVQFN